MLVIGLTGGLGTGKTTVAGMFAKAGAKVLHADKIARQAISPKGRCFKRVVGEFGQEILTKGVIDRKKVAEVVFSNTKKRRALERIIHPEVRKVIKTKIREHGKGGRKTIIVLDVPLLFESGMDALADLTVVVKASRARQLARTANKMNLTKTEAMRRIKAQMPLRKKIRLADMIIDNNGSLTNTKKQVKQIWEKL